MGNNDLVSKPGGGPLLVRDSWYSRDWIITDDAGRVICWPDMVAPTRAIAVALFGWLECWS